MGDSTDIDSLIKEMNSSDLSQEENSMVNSILNDFKYKSDTLLRLYNQGLLLL